MSMGNLTPTAVEAGQDHFSALATHNPQSWPIVSVVVPCRNEEQFITICVSSLLANDYPSDRLEIIVVDGISEDRTSAIVESFVRGSPIVKLLENPKKIMPAAVNLGIQYASGKVIMIVGAHARVAPDYISRCVDCLLKCGADNVGGVMDTVPQQGGLVGMAIVASLSHRFGVGNAYFRIRSDQPRWVDTVFGGCYRKEVFDKIGHFNERLLCTQDMEFNRRLVKSGGKILLVPDIICCYYARSDIKSFWNHNFRNGVWTILPFVYTDVIPIRLRHVVPLVFVTSVIGSAILAMRVELFLWLLLVILGSYFVTSIVASIQIAWRKRDFRFFILMPLLFSMLHFGYGFGSACGAIKALGISFGRLLSMGESSE
jgi:cellulose synthase/poly-beta-1,6-N-acetylglucosamine synthase-like glycosyltransferase